MKVLRSAFVVSLAAACAAAGATAGAKPKAANPSFSVSVESTYVRRHITQIATKPQANGCVFHLDADATQLVTTKLQQPVVLTYKQLRRGVKPFALLLAKETRGGSYSYGYQDGCPYLKDTPRFVADTKTCGKASFKVLSENAAVGYIGGTNNFRFSYLYNGPDAFDGECVHEVFATDAIGLPDAAIINGPPIEWQSGAHARPWWTVVDPKKLLGATKPLVVKFKSSGTITNPDPTGSPQAYDEALDSDTFTFSWTVTLTPVKG